MYLRHFVFLAAFATPFALPAAQISPLQAKIVTEKLETIEMPRIRLEGERDIQLDYYDGFSITKPKNESFLLTHRYLPNHEFSLTVFPDSAIPGGVTPGNISKYLRKLSEGAIRRQEFFEVVTLPTDDNTPTKLRFLGAKPVTIEYIIKREVDGETMRIFVQENWAQLDGTTYLLRIEAPEERFENFFNMAKGMASSMYFIN
ncbi:hypothetical protein [Cerasicoccus maritimus]|uniref:hypothetical protein n=1 Tax=Cerasicoccus maritimus TaxID=490089 RepID=UPI0028525A4A|nr:hypothetical protein [Cerasicoccus maritimus]